MKNSKGDLQSSKSTRQGAPLTADQSQLYSSCNPQGQDTSSNTIQVSALDLLYATTSRKTSVQTRESLPLPRVSPVARAQVVAYRSELSLTGRRDAIYIAVRDRPLCRSRRVHDQDDSPACKPALDSWLLNPSVKEGV